MIQHLRETQILDAAEALLIRFGTRRMTMDDVAEMVGLSRPALYQYFSSKSELIKQVLRRFHANVLGQVEAALSLNRPLKDQLKLAIMARDGLYLEHSIAAGGEAWYLDANNLNISNAYNFARDDFQSLISEHLSRSGTAEQSATAKARLIISSAAGLRAMVSERGQFEDEVSTFIDLLLDAAPGVSTTPSTTPSDGAANTSVAHENENDSEDQPAVVYGGKRRPVIRRG